MKHINIPISEELWERLRDYAHVRHERMTDVVRRSVERELQSWIEVDAVSDVSVSSRGKGKVSLPKVLPRRF